MITKIATWIYEKLGTCTAEEEPLLLELIYFIRSAQKTLSFRAGMDSADGCAVPAVDLSEVCAVVQCIFE